MYTWDIWEDEPVHIWTSDEPMVDMRIDIWDEQD